MLIDFHTHAFPDHLAPRALASLAKDIARPPLTDGTVSGLLSAMDSWGVDRAVVCNIATNPKQTANVNAFAAETAREHPDRLLRYRGRHWRAGLIRGGVYALDIDSPGTRQYLQDVFRCVFDEWGFDLVKLDFLYAAAPFHSGDHGKSGDGPFTESRAGRMIRAMEWLRELCGEKLMLGCGVPLMPAFGLADYCRVGSDVSTGLDDLPVMGILHRERVSTRQSVRNTIFRRQLNGRAFGNDPDVYFLRDKKLGMLSKEEKEYLAMTDALFGSVRLTSDDLNAYDEAKAAYQTFVDKYPDHYMAEQTRLMIPKVGMSPEEMLDQILANANDTIIAQ